MVSLGLPPDEYTTFKGSKIINGKKVEVNLKNSDMFLSAQKKLHEFKDRAIGSEGLAQWNRPYSSITRYNSKVPILLDGIETGSFRGGANDSYLSTTSNGIVYGPTTWEEGAALFGGPGSYSKNNEVWIEWIRVKPAPVGGLGIGLPKGTLVYAGFRGDNRKKFHWSTPQAQNGPTEEEKAEGWRSIFHEKGLDKIYRREEFKTQRELEAKRGSK